MPGGRFHYFGQARHAALDFDVAGVCPGESFVMKLADKGVVKKLREDRVVKRAREDSFVNFVKRMS